MQGVTEFGVTGGRGRIAAMGKGAPLGVTVCTKGASVQSHDVLMLTVRPQMKMPSARRGRTEGRAHYICGEGGAHR